MTKPLHIPFPSFDQTITIVSISETSDGYGGFSDPSVETVIATEDASFLMQSGTEIWQSGRIVGTADFIITMWYNSNVTIKTIIKLGTRKFEIMNLDNVGMKNEYLVLYCNEQV